MRDKNRGDRLDLTTRTNGYDPERWDVVRVPDGVVIVPGTSIASADDACTYLNARQGYARGPYEVRPSHSGRESGDVR